jgi:hypothetical protein
MYFQANNHPPVCQTSGVAGGTVDSGAPGGTPTARTSDPNLLPAQELRAAGQGQGRRHIAVSARDKAAIPDDSCTFSRKKAANSSLFSVG